MANCAQRWISGAMPRPARSRRRRWRCRRWRVCSMAGHRGKWLSYPTASSTWWCDVMIARRRLLTQLFPICAALPAILTGCGWEPLYADQQTAAGSAELRAIKVNPITERIGQNLETGLRESLNPGHVPTKSLYLLKVTLSQSLQDLGIQSQGLGTRGEVHIQANYSLVEISTGKILQNG